MSERENERKEQYHRVRTEFDELDSEDKVVFLVEAAVTTLARGIDTLGQAVSEEISSAFSKRAAREEEADAAKPEDDAATASSTNGHGGEEAAEDKEGTSEGDAEDTDATP